MQNKIYTHDNPIPHRAHKKSTNGCKACKIRKVKCDEQRPVCGKCTIHFSNIAACDYDSAPQAKAKRRRPINLVSITSKTRDPVALPTSTSQASCSTSRRASDQDQSCTTSSSQKSSIGLDKDAETTGTCRNYPCQCSSSTNLMLDGIGGKCRNCGCQPYQPSDTQCSPILSNATFSSGSLDPFSILPAKSSPRVHALAYHWNNILALFPTKINSQYCTNPTWMSQAVNNETFFNVTLYVSSIHDAGLRGQRGTSESLYYKSQTIKLLNKALRDPEEAVSDETLAAVLLLTHIVSLIGEPNEAEIHMNGLRQMMSLRGGIQHYTLDGVFLHMLCIVNHLTAVISESPTIIPSSGIPYKPKTSCSYSSVENSPLLKPFAVSICFHPTVVDLLHDLGYLYFVLDVFTRRFMPEFREAFEDVLRSIEEVSKAECEMKRDWAVERLRRWGDGKVMVTRSYGKA